MKKANSLALRTLSGAMLTLVLVGCLFMGWEKYLALVMSAGAIFELNKALYPTAKSMSVLSGILAAALVAVTFVWGTAYLPLALAAGLIVVFAGGMLLGHAALEPYMKGLLGFIYPALPLCFLVLTLAFADRKMALLAFVSNIVLVSIADMAAYFVGRALGRRKLCPEISPHKTVAGALGAVAFAVLFGYIVSLIAPLFGITIPFWHYLILGGICGVISQFGDLTASIIKRGVGLKDYASILPGMGGLLDRIDGILFCAVPVYVYFLYVLHC